MGPLHAPAFAFIMFLCLKTSLSYMEALATHTDSAAVGQFEPEVAFICNKPAMHRVVNGWEADFNTNCLTEPEQILDYCKKIYPDHDVKNVIELNYRIEIADWPTFASTDNTKAAASHKVTPFKCLVGDFESEALLVPQHCIFDHEHDSNRCERPSNWTKTAAQECEDRGMVLESSGMLVVCDTDKFRGVEYVCCPPEADTKPTDASWEAEASKEDADSSSEEVEQDDDDYMKYLRGDDMDKYDNEHMKFKAAERAMQKQQHEKVTKMMKEWQDAREHVSLMRKTNRVAAERENKEITETFRRRYHAFQLEGGSEKKQLVSLHQQRVQAMFNKKKRVLKQSYREELEADEPTPSKVLSFLKLYIRTEEKDRLHTVNHYEHLRDTDPEEALRIRDSVVTHLNLISQRIEEAVNTLHRVPELEAKIKEEIEEFRKKRFRKIEISTEDVVLKPVAEEKKQETIEIIPIGDAVEEGAESASVEEHDFTNIQIDSETDILDNKDTFMPNAQSDSFHVQQTAFKEQSSVQSVTTTNAVGIAIGSVAVFIIIVVAVVMMKKRSRRQPITHGFVEVDPAASPEERHVANMQMNGYENPTYRYFEMNN